MKPVSRHQEEAAPVLISANGGWSEIFINQSMMELQEIGGQFSTTVTDVVVNFAGVQLPLDPYRQRE